MGLEALIALAPEGHSNKAWSATMSTEADTAPVAVIPIVTPEVLQRMNVLATLPLFMVRRYHENNGSRMVMDEARKALTSQKRLHRCSAFLFVVAVGFFLGIAFSISLWYFSALNGVQIDADPNIKHIGGLVATGAMLFVAGLILWDLRDEKLQEFSEKDGGFGYDFRQFCILIGFNRLIEKTDDENAIAELVTRALISKAYLMQIEQAANVSNPDYSAERGARGEFRYCFKLAKKFGFTDKAGWKKYCDAARAMLPVHSV